MLEFLNEKYCVLFNDFAHFETFTSLQAFNDNRVNLIEICKALTYVDNVDEKLERTIVEGI